MAVACGNDRSTTPTIGSAAARASLGGVAAARVGDVSIDRAEVLAIARAQRVSIDDAVARKIDDSLLGHAAIAAGAGAEPKVTLGHAAALSRAKLIQLRGAALVTQFTDEELAAAVDAQWLDVEHPELRNVVHALVKTDVPNARAVAEALRGTLFSATGPDAAKSGAAFVDAAKSFKVPSGPPVYVENLKIAADGRVAEAGMGGSVHESFTRAAFAIPDVLGTSDVVETNYGFHVLRLLEKEPALRLTREQKLEKLRPDLVARRVRPAHDQLLTQLHAATKVEILANDALLSLPR